MGFFIREGMKMNKIIFFALLGLMMTLNPTLAQNDSIARWLPSPALTPDRNGPIPNLWTAPPLEMVQASQTVQSRRIRVTSPNGGEVWEKGRTFPIRWTSSGSIPEVRIGLKWGPGVGVWIPIADRIPNTGEYSYTVPETLPQEGGEFMVIVMTPDGLISDSSDGAFSIQAAKEAPKTASAERQPRDARVIISVVEVARPRLGNPLILMPHELKRFEITVAGRLRYGEETEIPIPTPAQVMERLRQVPPRITVRGREIPLNVLSVGGISRHPKFQSDYGSGKFAPTGAEQQYEVRYRWEARVSVGLGEDQINDLKTSVGWPAFLALRILRDPDSGEQVSNPHAIYVHETLSTSSEFTILHITDTHITRRNDQIPEILCRVRNQSECDMLAARYINFNDNLRAFIKLANARVRAGEKVIVVLTGDIVDYYFDGWWDGKFICGQGEFAKDRREEATGSSWGYSNVAKFYEIILGLDGKGEELLCPLFTVLGNHDYLANEVPLSLKVHLKVGALRFSLYSRYSHKSYGLLEGEGREYDYWAYPRHGGKHTSIASRKHFKENLNKSDWVPSLDQDWSYWLPKPKSWPLSQYISTVNYDTDFRIKIGNHQLLFLNTGADRYPRQEEFADLPWEDREDEDRDYIEDGPHNRGIVGEHLKLVERAMEEAPEHGMILMFTHAPLIGMEKNETEGMQVLFEQEHEKNPRAAASWLVNLYRGYKKNYDDLVSNFGFLFSTTRQFKVGTRDPLLNFNCADGESVAFLDRINRLRGVSTKTPVLVFSGHTHKVHEFRIERVIERPYADPTNFYYFTDDYSGKYFRDTTDGAQLLLRYLWLRANSPLLFTSGGAKREKPQYREIKVSGGTFASLEMREVPDGEKTANFTPGCRSVALRASKGQFVCAFCGGAWREVLAESNEIKDKETFELIHLDDGKVAFRSHYGPYLSVAEGRIEAKNTSIGASATFKLIGVGAGQVVLLAYNGKYVCAEGGGGRELAANRSAIGPWETFTLIELEKAGQVALQSFNYPDHFIRHRNFLGEVTVIGTEMDRKDATFRIVPGLAEQNYPSLQGEYISLQSVNYPGYYLRHQDTVVKLHKYSEDDLFKKDATFRLIPGLADRTRSSLESLNYPGFHIRHKNFKLYLEKGDGDLFRKDATFQVLSPPW
jgi:hypothetical protein